MNVPPDGAMTDAELDAEDAAVERALRIAVRDAILQHQRAGNSVVVARDGEIVEIPASHINLDD